MEMGYLKPDDLPEKMPKHEYMGGCIQFLEQANAGMDKMMDEHDPNHNMPPPNMHPTMHGPDDMCGACFDECYYATGHTDIETGVESHPIKLADAITHPGMCGCVTSTVEDFSVLNHLEFHL